MSDAQSFAATLIRLIRARGIGTARLREAMAAAGGLAPLVEAGPRGWRALGLDPDAIAAVDARQIAADLDWLARDHHHLLHVEHPDWPALLRDEPSAPVALFVHGDPEELGRPQVAVVGARRATPQGLDNARDFAAGLARAGLVVTSGLALGIDGAAHAGALDAGGLSVAVAATGPDLVYPARHRELARRIVAEGALVSEFPVGTGVRPEHFPRRNRVISVLALGVLVVEAAERSGSLVTARHAAEQGRELFAIPGSIHNPMARGCHRLIRDGAKLVESVDDILEEIAPLLPAAIARPAGQPEPSDAGEALDPDARELLAALPDAPTSVDALCGALGWHAGRAQAALLALELSGLAARTPDGGWMRAGGRR